MTRKTHDLCVKTGSYTDREGNEKGRWMNVGALMEGDSGPFIMLNAAFNPAGIYREDGRESILISCFEPQQDQQEPRQQQRAGQQRQPPRSHGDRPGGPKNRPQAGGGFDDMGSDIPF